MKLATKQARAQARAATKQKVVELISQQIHVVFDEDNTSSDLYSASPTYPAPRLLFRVGGYVLNKTKTPVAC